MSTHTNTGTPQRNVIAHISMSLDGRVNGPGGASDIAWADKYADASRDLLAELPKTATAVVLGRRNYEAFGHHWSTVLKDDSADARDRTVAQWLEKVRKIVRTSTLADGDLSWNNSRLSDPDPAAEITRLRPQPIGGDIVILNSAGIIADLLKAKEIDRLHITLCPETLGTGTRLFDDGIPGASWNLTTPTTAPSGATALIYDRVRG
ncbi:dihydrofolate reductase family protein [Streptomyces sp. NPDC046821]|uniref:dihydrofolate reductase family protein n=1 Tax=Streptomyces sp. NPDC046821 TaxID=3154702 RepID=UPI00341176F6